jgi:DNA-binding PadR family transcriptional regulator
MTFNEARLLAIIDRAAADGQPCPTNDQLCTMLDYASMASPARTIARLKAAGMVTAEMVTHNARVVTITDAGRAWLAQSRTTTNFIAVPPKAQRGLATTRPGQANQRHGDALRSPPIGDVDERNARLAADKSNAAFLNALQRVKRVPEPDVPAEGRFRHLPPPALSGQAIS